MRLSNQQPSGIVAKSFTTWSITPKDLGVSSRKVNYWKSQSLLPYFGGGAHLRMNIFQAMWFAVVDELTSVRTSPAACLSACGACLCRNVGWRSGIV